MAVENLLRRYNVPKRIWEAKRWYKELDPPEKWLFWMCIGGYFGVFYGTHKRHERERNMVSQHMVVTRYNVAPDDIKHFEQYWNDSARLNQRQHGYEYTKLYKAISMEKSPFQYFSVRMWARAEDEEHFLMYILNFQFSFALLQSIIFVQF